MDTYAVLGNPIAHSRSPRIHARFAELTGQSMRYEALLVPLGEFRAAVDGFRGRGGRGCNVTVPFKFDAAEYAGAGLSARARLAGACNTLCFDGDKVVGDNTDGIGLVRDIEHHAGVSLRGQRILLVGAGGAAAGVLGPLLEAAPAGIRVVNRTPASASQLVAAHEALAAKAGVRLQAAGLDDCGEAHDVVINATATSLGGGEVPVPAGVLRPGTLAYDMMYGPAARTFMAWAESHGAVPRDGLGMLVEQAAESFNLWRGVRPDSARVLDEMRRALAQEHAPS